jgi:hypothetical protein
MGVGKMNERSFIVKLSCGTSVLQRVVPLLTNEPCRRGHARRTKIAVMTLEFADRATSAARVSF